MQNSLIKPQELDFNSDTIAVHFVFNDPFIGSHQPLIHEALANWVKGVILPGIHKAQIALHQLPNFITSFATTFTPGTNLPHSLASDDAVLNIFLAYAYPIEIKKNLALELAGNLEDLELWKQRSFRMNFFKVEESVQKIWSKASQFEFS
jgi:hypothetical protein